MFPITITLHNAGQLQAVIAALNAESAPPAGAPTTAAEVKAERDATGSTMAEAKAAVKAKETEAPAEGNAAQAASAQPTAKADKADAPEQKAVTYAELQASVLKLHKLDSNAAKPIAEGMGFPNFKAMPDDKWAEALAKVEAALDLRGA